MTQPLTGQDAIQPPSSELTELDWRSCLDFTEAWATTELVLYALAPGEEVFQCPHRVERRFLYPPGEDLCDFETDSREALNQHIQDLHTLRWA